MQLYDVGYGTAIVLALIGLSRYRKLSHELRFFAIYLLVDVLVTTVQFYAASLHKNNLWTVHLYLPLQYGFTVWTLSYFLRADSIRNVVRFSIPVFTVVWLVVLLTLESLTTYSTFNKPFATALMILVSMITMYSINRDTTLSMRYHPGFWISTASLLYFATVFMLFLMFNYILAISQEMLGKVYQIQAVIGIVKNIMYSIAFFCPFHSLYGKQVLVGK